MAITGVAASCLSQVDSLAFSSSSFSKRELTKEMTFLFQGDSITDGNRGRNNDPNHIMGHGYAFSIASRMGVNFAEKNLHFINRGISANKIIDLAARWQTDTLDLKPDVLSILIGINDASSMVTNWEPQVPVEKYAEVYKSLLDQTKAALPNILFVLCEPFILPVGRIKENWEAYNNDLDQRKQIVKKLAAEYNAVFVELQTVFTKACDRASAEYWMWDGIHPTVAGHELLAREWLMKVGERIEF